MEHISEALKERNIILETNDPVVADGFTQVPNFILKNSPPYTFFLLNDDMKLNRNRQFLV